MSDFLRLGRGEVKNRKRSETRVLDFVRKPLMFIDIGVGTKSEWVNIPKTLFSNGWTQCEVVGVEPSPLLYDELKEHNFPGLLFNVAMDETLGHRELTYVTEGHCYGQNNIYGLESPNKSHAKALVECWTLDHLAEKLEAIGKPIPNRTILWADIEGAEVPMLRGGDKLLSSGKIKAINIELRPHYVDSPSTRPEADKLLAKYGYTMALRYNVHKRDGKVTHFDAIYTR